MTPQTQNIPFGTCYCGCGGKAPIVTESSPSRGLVVGQPFRYIKHHHQRKSPVQYVVEDHGFKTPCWIWQWSVNHLGYGMVQADDGKFKGAHKVYWERVNGPTPKGMELDHLCHNPDTCEDGKTCIHRRCVNHDHLEPATHGDNVRRGLAGRVNGERQSAKTVCANGHPLQGENVYINGRGSRSCRICRYEAKRKFVVKPENRLAAAARERARRARLRILTGTGRMK